MIISLIGIFLVLAFIKIVDKKVAASKLSPLFELYALTPSLYTVFLTSLSIQTG